jgi:hypothetical protein
VWLKKLYSMVLLVVLFCSSVHGQDISAARQAIEKSKLLLTALEQNWQLRETLNAERENNLNSIQLSLEAREAFLNETEAANKKAFDDRELLLQATEKSLSEREKMQGELESSREKIQTSFETLDKAFKKQSWRLGVTKVIAWVGWGLAMAGWTAFAVSTAF